jgi:hypothetical protein
MFEHFPVVLSQESSVHSFPSLQVLTVRWQDTELSIGFFTQVAVSHALAGLHSLHVPFGTQVVSVLFLVTHLPRVWSQIANLHFFESFLVAAYCWQSSSTLHFASGGH